MTRFDSKKMSGFAAPVSNHVPGVLLVLFLLMAAGATGAEPGAAPAIAQRKPATDTRDENTAASAIETELLEQLGAIGYLAGTEEATGASGVTRYEPRRVAGGMNLLTSGHGPVAILMNMEGEVVHEWRAEFADVFPDHPKRNRAKNPHRNYWRDVVLFPNGDLLVLWELFGLFKLDRESRLLWAVAEPAHHDLQVTEQGEIVHLQAARKMISGIPEKRAIEDLIVTRDANGHELRRLAMSEVLRNADWLGLRKAFWKRALERSYGLTKRGLFDPFHTNSLWLLSEEEAAGFGHRARAGDALVSMAMLDTIAVIDMVKGVTRWWQQGPFGMQHQPHPTPDGNIILFNNFKTAETSTILTLNPRTRTVVSEYAGTEAEPLYSKRSGRVHVLPNGNVLIVETEGGRALELSAEDHQLVWEFRSPYRTGEDGSLVASLYSLDRVDTSHTRWLSQ